MATFTYENQYGKLEIKTAGPYVDVSSIRTKDIDPALAFDMDTSEKIALVTGNRGIQLVFTYPFNGRVFLLHHGSSSIAAVCEVVSLEFNKSVDAREILDRPNPYRRVAGI